MKALDEVRGLVRRGEPGAKRRVEELERLYLAGVSSADRAVGRLIEGLEAAGVLDDAVFVLTADHGETFDRPEEVFDHGETVFDDTVHTPLIVRLPGGWGGGTRVSTVVSNVDVAPTLLDLLGQARVERMDGDSLVDLLRGDPWAAWRPPAFAEATKPHRPGASGWLNDKLQKMVRTDDHKLVWDPAGDRAWLFAPDLDPGELRDLKKREAAEADRLTDRLKGWARGADPLRAEPVRSDEVKTALEALGYVDEAPARRRKER
jgi:arylsulfatase A-like enzyme